MQGKDQPGNHLRLADLLAALSLVTDLGMGQPAEEAMRACMLATRLAQKMQLPTDDAASIYYTTLLKYIGCTAYAHEEAALFGGDDIAVRAAGARVDFSNAREVLSLMLFNLAPQTSPVRRAAIIVGAMARGQKGERALSTAHCEVGSNMARRLGLAPAVQQGLYQIFERWDGKGGPHKLARDGVALSARFAQLATQAVLFDRLGGPDLALDVVRRRAGTALDPSIAGAFLQHGPALLAEIAAADVWATVVEAEPEPRCWIPTVQLDTVARAFADMVDLKVPCTRGHSAGVAALAERAARSLSLDADDAVAVRRAGLLHDLGRIGVPNCIWEKPGRLTAGEWEQVRLHPYHSERILSCSPALAPLATLAGMHHERLDGSGYHRQATGPTLPLRARLLAAADSYQAMSQDRPQRPALPPEAAAEQLTAEANHGRLDHDAVRAVLAAAGQSQARQRREWPAGLSDREVEVLRLIATGSSYREVARHLTITPKTAEHHIEHIYNKIDVSSRAAAAMFAMEHDLLLH